MKDLKDHIKSLIASDTLKAISTLQSLIKFHQDKGNITVFASEYDETVLHKSQYKQAEDDFNQGILPSTDRNFVFQRVRKALIDMLNQFSDSIFEIPDTIASEIFTNEIANDEGNNNKKTSSKEIIEHSLVEDRNKGKIIIELSFYENLFAPLWGVYIDNVKIGRLNPDKPFIQMIDAGKHSLKVKSFLGAATSVFIIQIQSGQTKRLQLVQRKGLILFGPEYELVEAV